MAKGYLISGAINLESVQATASRSRLILNLVLASTASEPGESAYSLHKPQHPSTDHPIAFGWRVRVRVVGLRHHGQTPRKDSRLMCNHASFSDPIFVGLSYGVVVSRGTITAGTYIRRGV